MHASLLIAAGIAEEQKLGNPGGALHGGRRLAHHVIEHGRDDRTR